MKVSIFLVRPYDVGGGGPRVDKAGERILRATRAFVKDVVRHVSTSPFVNVVLQRDGAQGRSSTCLGTGQSPEAAEVNWSKLPY